MSAALVVVLCVALASSTTTGDVHEVSGKKALTLTCNGDAEVRVSKWRHFGQTKETVIRYLPATKTYTCNGSLSSKMADCRTGVEIDERFGRRLTIKTPTMADAGTYICVMADSTTWSIEVTVVDVASLALGYTSNTTKFAPINDEDNDTEVTVDSDIYLSCSVAFSGTRYPSMELRTWNYWRGERVLSRTVIGVQKTRFYWNYVGIVSATERMRIHGNSLFPSQHYRASCHLPNVSKTSHEAWFKLSQPRDITQATAQMTIVLATLCATIVFGFIALVVVCFIRRRRLKRQHKIAKELQRQARRFSLRLERLSQASTDLQADEAQGTGDRRRRVSFHVPSEGLLPPHRHSMQF